MYRYAGCGLPNVFLKNGYKVVKTPYGEGVTIHDLDGLHLALGSIIVSSPHSLSGAEFRFIRAELELSQKMLAELLGCNEQAVARWEKGRSKVDAPAERLLRLLYKQAKLGEKKLAVALQSLRVLECALPAPRKFVASEKGAGWSAKSERMRA
ncbi:helix-turn-helix domain-containing protein [Lysobacter sp. CA199]|uniref:helix-turn-helix domain-containing protein n=1 Tax=Lysobacter sp. CA199 TaxID=3455608 RepID=UPI003F8D52F3